MELILGNVREEIWAKDISENTEDSKKCYGKFNIHTHHSCTGLKLSSGR